VIRKKKNRMKKRRMLRRRGRGLMSLPGWLGKRKGRRTRGLLLMWELKYKKSKRRKGPRGVGRKASMKRRGIVLASLGKERLK